MKKKSEETPQMKATRMHAWLLELISQLEGIADELHEFTGRNRAGDQLEVEL